MISFSKSDFVSVALGSMGIACAAPVFASSAHVEKVEKNNIVLIITDQQTANAMSCVGNPHLKTPAMDALAKDGVLFSRSYVAYPLSGPSRASLITGMMPVELGVKDNGGKLADEVMQNSIGNVVSEAGYDCLYAGKWHAPEIINLPAEGTGFTKVCDMNDPELVDHCIPHLQQKRNKPLFLVASFLNPHEICEFARDETLHYGNLDIPHVSEFPPLPYNAAIPAYYPEAITLHRTWVPKSYPTQLYTDDDWRKYLYAYYRLVERVDNEIGRLVAELKKNDLYDNSLIMFVSDHGDGAAAHRANQKRVLQEEIIRVPFIVKAPKSKKGNLVNDKALVNTSLDIYQTICDYAGVGANASLQGKSVRPILEGKTDKLHSEVYVETLLDGIDTRGWTVIGDKYKLTLYRYYKNKEQLFDLSKDPYEMQNLAVDKAYNQVVQDMKKKLYDHAIQTNDKFLTRILKHEID